MIEQFSQYFVYDVFKLSRQSQIGSSLDFFVYDSIKIFLLLIIVTHLMSWLRAYLPLEKIRDIINSKKFYGLDYLLASIFGAITPFCSCSSIPLFVGFVGAGVPLGVTFAFLITSPLVNEVALTLFAGLFGLKVTIIYAVSGIMLGVIGGMILGRLKIEKYIDNKFLNITPAQVDKNGTRIITFKKISREAFDIINKIYIYILVGIAIGALIHGYVPTGYFEGYLSGQTWWSVPVAVILAVPLYSNASGVIPIIQALVAKGVPLGTALAFMMATVGLSLPEALMLKRVMKLKLLLIFFATVTISIIILGYLFNINMIY